MDSRRSPFRYDSLAIPLISNDPGDRRSTSARSHSPPRGPRVDATSRAPVGVAGFLISPAPQTIEDRFRTPQSHSFALRVIL
jgi:hypothetical protein